jgi:hypothetical protein
MYGWAANLNSPFRVSDQLTNRYLFFVSSFNPVYCDGLQKSLEKQKDEPKMEFRDRSRETIAAFATQGEIRSYLCYIHHRSLMNFY